MRELTVNNPCFYLNMTLVKLQLGFFSFFHIINVLTIYCFIVFPLGVKEVVDKQK